MANQNAVVGGITLTAEQVALLVRLQKSGISMEQLQNGSEPAPKAAEPTVEKREGIYWAEKSGKGNDGRDWVSFQVCRDYISRGVVKTDRILSAGPRGWERVFGMDNDGDSILMAALSFLQDHSEDFVAVTSGVDKFVMAYLAFRADLFGSNSDLLGTSEVADTGSEEVKQDEPISPREALEAYVALCLGKALSTLIDDAVLADFLASGSELEDYVAEMESFAGHGDVFAWLGEAGFPDENGLFVKHPENAPRGYATKARILWEALNEKGGDRMVVVSPVQTPAEEVSAEPVEVVNPIIVTAGARKHYSGLLSQLSIWTKATESEKEALIVEVYSLVQIGGAKWTEVRDGLKQYGTVSEYFASVA